jgi:hypothetical protein
MMSNFNDQNISENQLHYEKYTAIKKELQMSDLNNQNMLTNYGYYNQINASNDHLLDNPLHHCDNSNFNQNYISNNSNYPDYQQFYENLPPYFQTDQIYPHFNYDNKTFNEGLFSVNNLIQEATRPLEYASYSNKIYNETYNANQFVPTEETKNKKTESSGNLFSNATYNQLDSSIKVELLDRDLWDQFNTTETEMIISKAGRFETRL